MNIIKEKWHILDFKKGYENFYISNTGKIKNKRTNKILKPEISNTGYKRCNLYNKITKKQKKFSVHRLVGLYFVEGNTKLTINHKDGNKLNNFYTNLEWVTIGENISHAYKTNLRNENGKNNPANCYNEKEINKICQLIEKNLSTEEISIKVFNRYLPKYKNLINHIKNHRRWTVISKNYNF